jgi:hypothetical protein
MRRLVCAALLSLVCAGPAAAQQPPVGESLLKATRTGDTGLMDGLRGTRATFAGAVVRVYRDTKSYRDYLVAADANLAADAAGPLRFLVRVGGDLRATPPPAAVAGAGEVSDFEMEPVKGKLRWYPVITLDAAP